MAKTNAIDHTKIDSMAQLKGSIPAGFGVRIHFDKDTFSVFAIDRWDTRNRLIYMGGGQWVDA